MGALDPTAVLRDPERLAALRRLQILDSPPTPAFERRVRLVARFLDVPLAFVAFLDAERQFVKSATGLAEPWASERNLPLDWGFCPFAVARGAPLLIDNAGGDDVLGRNWVVTEFGMVAYVGVPLVDDAGYAVGVISAVDVRPRAWSDDQVELLSLFADSLMVQLQLQTELEKNQRLVEISARAANREHTRAGQLRGLAETAMLATSTMALDERLRVVTEQARSLIGTRAAVVTVVANHSSEPINYLSVADEHGTRVDEDPLAADAISMPLLGQDGRSLGTIRISEKVDGSDFTEEDKVIFEQLARIASVAIESIQEYEREHEIATTLQESFLPQELPDVKGLDLAADYLPSTIGMAVGGDWYDAVPISDSSVALVVGDVVGHGVRAAAIMGQMRNALRTYLLEGLRPSRVLERLDRMAEGFDAGDFATVVVVELEPETGFVRWSSAGQLPPLVVPPGDADGAYLEGSVAPPAGSGLPAVHSEFSARLEPGTTLVLYTDGLVESRTQPLDEGLRRLRASTVAALGGDDDGCRNARGIVQALIAELTGPDREDDVALLVACMLPR